MSVRVHYPPGGKVVTGEADVMDGHLVITDTYQELRSDLDPDWSAYILTLRQAELNGMLVLDPARSRALAAEAGWPEAVQE